jgi:DtxR family transcriptional regulator, Mn-dependent transcriptional regulator
MTDSFLDSLFSLLGGMLLVGLALGFFWPRGGLVGRWCKWKLASSRVLNEDALKHLFNCESHGQTPNLHSLAGSLAINPDRAARLLAELEGRELVSSAGGRIRLTDAGKEYALQVIRAHRLWERYLAEETGFTPADWHGRAEQYEHFLSAEAVNSLAAQLGYPTHDPHGDPIPTSNGHLVGHGGLPLTALEVNQAARIVHIEDEPEAVYAQLVAEGLSPGMSVRLAEINPQRVRFWSEGAEHVLAPIVAANLSVLPLPAETMPLDPGESLEDLRLGQAGEVRFISPRCRGPERRRFLDLGILPGTVIQAELVSPSGDPTAYRVRGALIGLRREQARLIHVRPLPEESE